MSDTNCICFRCKQPLIETNSYGQLLWGCVNCKLWWLARRPVRSHSSQEQLRALSQAPNQTQIQPRQPRLENLRGLAATLSVSPLKGKIDY